MDPHKIRLEGIDGFLAVIHLSFTLMGYYYIALGTLVLPAELKITDVNLDKFREYRKYVFLAIIIWSLFVSSLLVFIDGKIPVRMFYITWYCFAWLFSFRALYPFYRVVRGYANYWLYILLGILSGFLANFGEIIAFIVSDSLVFLSPLFYGFMSLFLILGFFNLGKDVGAF